MIRSITIRQRRAHDLATLNHCDARDISRHREISRIIDAMEQIILKDQNYHHSPYIRSMANHRAPSWMIRG